MEHAHRRQSENSHDVGGCEVLAGEPGASGEEAGVHEREGGVESLRVALGGGWVWRGVAELD